MTFSAGLRAGVALIVALGAVSGIPALTAAPAAADVQFSLPGEVKSLRMGDGTRVTLKRLGERARINPSLGATPLHRNVWVSGRYQISLSRKVKQLKVRPGYIVGCQVSFGGADTTNSEDFGGLADDELFGGGLGETVHLAPGQAVFFNLTDAERKDDFATERHEPYYRLKNTDHAKYRYVNAQMGLNGCVGFAQARSWMRLAVETDYAYQVLDFFGRPFSIG